jgi:hypothetical protein
MCKDHVHRVSDLSLVAFASGGLRSQPSTSTVRTSESLCSPHFALLKGSGEDVKTARELMWHAKSRLTLDVYVQALTPAKRAAHLKVVEMIRPTSGTLVVPLCSHAEDVSVCK